MGLHDIHSWQLKHDQSRASSDDCSGVRSLVCYSKGAIISHQCEEIGVIITEFTEIAETDQV